MLRSPIVARLTWHQEELNGSCHSSNDPGDKWNYSASTRVLGLIVEKVTGTALEAWYQEHSSSRSAWSDASWPWRPTSRSRVATITAARPARWSGKPRDPIPSTPTPPFRGDGASSPRCSDYGMFIRMLLNGGTLGPTTILKESSVRMMGENHIGSFRRAAARADQAKDEAVSPRGRQRQVRPRVQITSKIPQNAKYRSAGSMSWAGIFNTEFWIDPERRIAGVQMMQVLPFYDDGAIRTLREFEELVYQNLR